MINTTMLDLINGLVFECVGSWFAWRNALELYRNKRVVGVYWPVYAFYSVWGIWSLVYYYTLSQWVSLVGGAGIVSGNITWLMLALHYRLGKRTTRTRPPHPL